MKELYEKPEISIVVLNIPNVLAVSKENTDAWDDESGWGPDIIWPPR